MPEQPLGRAEEAVPGPSVLPSREPGVSGPAASCSTKPREKKQTHRPLPACTSPVGSSQSLWVYFNENNMKTWADSFLWKIKKKGVK